MEAAFDYVGRVIARRRFGYISEWRLLASWTEEGLGSLAGCDGQPDVLTNN